MCKNPTPSRCTHTSFISAYSPNYVEIDKVAEYFNGTLKTGKWMIIINRKNIDTVWERIKNATEANLLGTDAKVTTTIESDSYDSKRHTHLICVYTKNWKDEKEVWKIRQKLRGLDIVRPIGYKADEDTIAGKYKNNSKEVISKYYG